MQHGLVKEIIHLVISATTTKKEGWEGVVREHHQPPLRWQGVIGKAGPVITGASRKAAKCLAKSDSWLSGN